MYICQKRGLQLDTQLFLEKGRIPVVEETKFLGVIFDRRLSFVPHLKYVKKKGLKVLNIFKLLATLNGELTERLCSVFIYLKLDLNSSMDVLCMGFSCRCWILYTTGVIDFVLKHLNFCRELVLCAHEPSLGARLAKLSLIKSLPKHPMHDAVFNNKYMMLFEARPNVIRTFGLSIKQFLFASNI